MHILIFRVTENDSLASGGKPIPILTDSECAVKFRVLQERRTHSCYSPMMHADTVDYAGRDSNSEGLFLQPPGHGLSEKAMAENKGANKTERDSHHAHRFRPSSSLLPRFAPSVFLLGYGPSHSFCL